MRRIAGVCLRQKKAKARRLKPLFTWNRLGVICDLRRICYFATKLDVPHHEKPGDRRSFFSCQLTSLKADLEAIEAGQNAREEERSAAKPEVAGALVDPAAAVLLNEDLDSRDCPTDRVARRMALVPHCSCGVAVHAQFARKEVEKLLLAEKAPTPPGAEVSKGASTDTKAVSEVTGSAPSSPGVEVATLTPDEICKRDGDRLERLRSSPTSEEAARFANELGCEKLRPQLLGLMGSLGYAAPTPPAEEVSNGAPTCMRKLGRRSWVRNITIERREGDGSLKSRARIPWRDTHWLIPG